MIKYIVLTFTFLACVYFAEISLLSQGGKEISHAFDNYEKAPRPIKTLIIGHCEAATGIAPAYLGKHVFNFAMNDLNYFYTRKVLQVIMEKTDLESVIIPVNSLMFMGRFKMPTYTQRYFWFKAGIVPPSKDLVSTILSFGNHSQLLNDRMNQLIFKEISSKPHHIQYSSSPSTAPLQQITQDTYYQDGFRALTPSFDSEKKELMLDSWMKNFDFSDGKSEITELQTILSLLKDSSIKTTLLLLPQVSGMKDLIELRKPGTEKKLKETLSDIRKQYPGVRIHDMRANHDIPDSLFAETNQLSSKGADILGLRLRKIFND